MKHKKEGKRVLVLTNHQTGLYKFRRELLECLVQKGYKVYVSVPEGDFSRELKEIGIKLIDDIYLDRRGTNPIHDFKLYLHYRFLIKRIAPDVVLTYTIKPNVYGGYACGKMGVPYLANVTGLGTAVENSGIVQKLTITLYRKGLRRAKTVFCQNEENMNYLLSHKIIKGDYVLIPGSGVNLKQYVVEAYPSGDTIDFIFVARVMKEKGFFEYLYAAKRIRKKYPETRFHVYGFCEKGYEEIIERFDKQGVIIYHGVVDDMVPVYRMASCVVHPSFYPEGMSNVLLEAAASARPIITTDRSGCREVIDDGVNGYLVKPQDGRDLVDKIECFLDVSFDKRRDMGLAGRARVEKLFDRMIVIDAYIKEIELISSQ